MLRIIVRTDSAGLALNVGGAVHTEMRTFVVTDSDLEEYLSEKLDSLSQRQVIGVEIHHLR